MLTDESENSFQALVKKQANVMYENLFIFMMKNCF